MTSVYGPVATAVQALASLIGGDSVRLTIFVMALVNAAAFIGTALLLHRFTRGDADLQRRAALLWAVNPLMIYHLVAGMHVDTLAIACMVAALMAGVEPVLGAPAREWASGSSCNAGLVALGPAWELRRSPGRLAVVAGTATATVLVIYAPRRVARARPGRRGQQEGLSRHPVAAGSRAGSDVFGPGAYSTWIQVGSLLLLRGSGLADPAGPAGARRREPCRGPCRRDRAPAVAAAMVVAWLFAAPYALPWYDGLAFALLAMASWPVLEGFMVARVTILSLGYLPAREALRPEDLLWLKTLLRERVVPWSLLALTLALVWWAVSAGARARRPSASAAPPP